MEGGIARGKAGRDIFRGRVGREIYLLEEREGDIYMGREGGRYS